MRVDRLGFGPPHLVRMGCSLPRLAWGGAMRDVVARPCPSTTPTEFNARFVPRSPLARVAIRQPMDEATLKTNTHTHQPRQDQP